MLKERGVIYDWKYEADRFEFPNVRKGNLSYTPDFKIWREENAVPFYYEVKGYMDGPSRVKLSRMRKHYPEIVVEIVGRKEYNDIKKTFMQYIPDWET